MITKAIIVEAEADGYHFKVRMPLIHKIEGVPGGTLTQDLPTASVNCPPGVIPNYSVGDVVFVGLEDDQWSKPVILGSIYNETYVSNSSSLQSDSIEVAVGAQLPEANNIKVGEKTLEDILMYYSEISNSIKEGE